MSDETQTPTPRTDEMVREILSDLQSGTIKVVHADFARTLERELSQVRRELEQMSKSHDELMAFGADGLTRFKELQQERDTLRTLVSKKDEALRGVLHCLQHEDEYEHPQAVACDWCDEALSFTPASKISKEWRTDSALEELVRIRLALESLWSNCKIVCWPKDGSYPIEHNPHANKISRFEIESELSLTSATLTNSITLDQRKAKALELLSAMVWHTRWVSQDDTYQNMVGFAAEIRSGNYDNIEHWEAAMSQQGEEKE